MKKNRNWIKEYIPYVIIIIMIIVVRLFIVTPVRVSGNSMIPTLSNGEIMLLNKLSDINRYDIVVISKDVAGEEIIKRIIGMPGDSIEYKNNELYINDEVVKDIYGFGATEDFNKVFLGSDEYWVMGDNRDVSLDSRVFGKIKEDYIKGVTSFILYPFNKFGKIDYQE